MTSDSILLLNLSYITIRLISVSVIDFSLTFYVYLLRTFAYSFLFRLLQFNPNASLLCLYSVLGGEDVDFSLIPFSFSWLCFTLHFPYALAIRPFYILFSTAKPRSLSFLLLSFLTAFLPIFLSFSRLHV